MLDDLKFPVSVEKKVQQAVQQLNNMLDENISDCSHRSTFWCVVEVSDSHHTEEWVDPSPRHSGAQFVMFLGLHQNPQREYKSVIWHWYILDCFQSMCWLLFLSIFSGFNHTLTTSLNLWVWSTVLNLTASRELLKRSSACSCHPIRGCVCSLTKEWRSLFGLLHLINYQQRPKRLKTLQYIPKRN